MIMPFVVHAQNEMQTTREEAVSAAKGILQKTIGHQISQFEVYSIETVVANGHTVLYEVLF